MSPFSHISWESNRRTQSKVLGTKEKGKCYHQRIIMQIIIHLHFCLSLQAADVLRVVFMLLCFISQHYWNELERYNGFLFLMYDFYFFFFHFSFFRLMVICYLDLFMWSSWYTVLLLTLLMVWDLMKKNKFSLVHYTLIRPFISSVVYWAPTLVLAGRNTNTV